MLPVQKQPILPLLFTIILKYSFFYSLFYNDTDLEQEGLNKRKETDMVCLNLKRFICSSRTFERRENKQSHSADCFGLNFQHMKEKASLY